MPMNDTVIYKSMEDLLQLTVEETQLAMKQFVSQSANIKWGKHIILTKYEGAVYKPNTKRVVHNYFFKWTDITDSSTTSTIESAAIQMLSLMLKDN